MSASLSSPTIVFVHGIFSSGATFAEMKAEFEKRDAFKECLTFEYDYNQGLQDNGRILAESLKTLSGNVVLVGHSMGGLVARLAILTGELPHVRRVIMLATPNFGAIRTASAGLLAQLVLQATGRLSAVFRRPGVLELTRIPSIMERPIERGAAAVQSVEYVTIPALYFNEGRGSLDFGEWADAPLSTRLFASIGVGLELMALFPLWAPQMQRPHDGIVEERSNALVPDAAGHRSEKRRSLVDPTHWGYTYAHVSVRACDELNHVGIHLDPSVIALVIDLATASSLLEWCRQLTPEQRLEITVVPEPPAST